MKQFLLMFCLALCFTGASATHIRGGFITYKKDTNPSPDYRKLSFTLTVFTDRSSMADDPVVQISMGDGNKITVPRSSSTSVGDPSAMVDKEEYTWDYTYSSDGTYTVYWVGINRNKSILNVTPPSDQQTFFTQTTLNINSQRGVNNSPSFLAPEPIMTTLEQPLSYNFLAYDPDGDSLSFKLRNPLQRDGMGNISYLPGYVLPANMFACSTSTNTDLSKFKLDSRSGQLVWDTPCIVGEYVFAMVIEEWRNKVKIGEVTYDMQIIAQNSIASKLYLNKQENQKYTSEGYLISKINQEQELQIFYENIEPAVAPIIEDSGSAQFFASELSQLLNVPVTYTLENSTSGKIGRFRFTPSRQLIRNKPYFINFYGVKHGKPQTLSIGIIIRDDQPTLTLQEQNRLFKTNEGHFIILTNKPSKFIFFAENLEGHITSLHVESILKVSAKQFDFTVRDTTDGKVGELLFQPSDTQIDEAPQAIIFKATYNPARVAGERVAATDPIIKELQVQVIVAQQLPTSSQEELSIKNCLVFPNPAKDKIYIQAADPATFELYGLQGRLIFTKQVQPGVTEIIKLNATAGLYYYILTTENGNKKLGKLLLQ